MSERVRLGCWAAFWGDTSAAVDQILDGADDRLPRLGLPVRDHDGAAGAGPRQGSQRRLRPDALRVLTAATGRDPRARDQDRHQRRRAEPSGLRARASPRLPRRRASRCGSPRSRATTCWASCRRLRAGSAADMFTGEPLPPRPADDQRVSGRASDRRRARQRAPTSSSPAARSTRPSCSGRCCTSSAGATRTTTCCRPGTLAGHIVECGPQCTGGNFTDWDTVPGWDNMGFPVDRVPRRRHRDRLQAGRTPAAWSRRRTIGEQIVYEIGDPGAYVMPDVICDWRNVKLEQVGPNRVRASGARGSPPAGDLQGHRHPRRRLPGDDQRDVRRVRRRRQGPPRRRGAGHAAPSG